MPIHDWSRVDAGVFHHFHQAWTIELSHALNGGILPPGYFALAEQIVSGPIPDVVTLQRRGASLSPASDGGLALAEAPPKAHYVTTVAVDRYVGKSNRIVIQHTLGDVIAVIELVSPGNKSSLHGLRAFVSKAEELLRRGVNLLIVDLFPPTPRDAQGIHKAIWDEIQDEPFELPEDKRLTVAAYCASETLTAYVEPLAVGDKLPSSPIFLAPGRYVAAPLESTYETTWNKCPDELKEFVCQAGTKQ